MRRSEKEISDIKIIEAIIGKAQVARLGMCKDNIPYVVPVNFGYDGDAFYIHSAKIGKKIDILKANSQVVIEIDEAHELIDGNLACDYTMNFSSVIASGVATFLEEHDAKRYGLSVLMNHYAPNQEMTYNPKAVEAVAIIKITINHLSGKHSAK